MADQKKHFVHALILLALLVGIVAPAYAGTIRYDFDMLSPWKIYRQCNGVGAGPWSVRVQDGFIKVRDEGCSMGSMTGIHHTGGWADYEVKTRIQLRSLRIGVTLCVRAVKLHPADMGFHGSSYRIGKPMDTGKWYDVRIVAKGNKVTYFFDGKKVKEEKIRIKTGGIAFIAELSEFWLDYVEVILPVQPQGRLITCWAELKQS
jgi:hypothetical protein